MQLSEIKSIFHKELVHYYPKEEIDSFFYALIDHFLNLQKFVLVMQPNYVVSKEEESLLFNALHRLKQEEPLQHITGAAYFRNLTLKVTKDTLIPRPETEELVSWILEDVRENQQLKVLDIGTGSGCIALSIAQELLKASVTAIDISKEALAVAKQNAEKNGVAVNFLQADVLSDNFQKELQGPWDIIVSNPPYVRELEKAEIQKNVKDYEPVTALFVSDQDPLIFYQHITLKAKILLKPSGRLYFEINQYLPEETKQLLVENSFEQVELKKDIFGNFRMLKGIKSGKN
ncbi:peptide chain release factor N(5)-glutamine methyltransferase [Croceivirga sp. JEA036]|uniref:peptide chain release factor N(5)-glutamine methyltransferase n=1 Tax=Croceivirga sp. JEA036 TaxID=2721162 RepID=UPI00143AF10D|nr:peptide chain release factor N(5)-glutamine methyltransferase [Croceivirga sp. JEA036]NJB35879.1 peptide chain release factor N(5)-glutamine methyltransferase [Croceivirga sp. JEA036]